MDSVASASPPSSSNREQQNRINRLLEATKGFQARTPSWLTDTLTKLLPVIEQAVTVGAPLAVKLFEQFRAFLKMVPTNTLLAAYGLGLCFFGGYFAASVVALEAFRLSGWDATHACLADLAKDWDAIVAANADDKKRDDVKAMNASDRARHKFVLFLQVVNPDRVMEAVGGLYMGFMGVIAALKIHFALVVTLGLSIGNELRKPAATYLVPALAQVIPPAYHKWINPIINYGCKIVACTIAWWIQQILSTTQTGVRGGLLFARSMMRLAIDRKIMNIDPDDSMLDEICGWALAFVGVYFQLSRGFLLPFPFSIILMPLSIIEWILRYLTVN